MRTREGIEPRYGQRSVGADVGSKTEGHSRGADGHGPRAPPGVEDRGTSSRQSRELGRSHRPLHGRGEGGTTHDGKEARRPMGSRIPPYEQRRGGTPPEQREVPMVAHSMATPPTRRGGPTAPTGVEWIAQQARRAPQTRYTALMHHFTVHNLRACFTALDGTKAPGVDGVTKAMYAQDVEENL